MRKTMMLGLAVCAVMTATSFPAFAAENEPILTAPAPAVEEDLMVIAPAPVAEEEPMLIAPAPAPEEEPTLIAPAPAAEEDLMLIAPAPAPEETVIGIPQITVNGEEVDLSKRNLSQYIFETNGNTMIPLRAVAETMGFTVGWDGENQAVTVGDDDWGVVLHIGLDNYFGVTKIKDAVGMTAPQSYGAAPQLVEDTTFVPAKMFELLDYSYSSVGQFVNFTKATANENNLQIPNPFIPYESIDAAKKALSFTPSVPSYLPTGYEIDEITAIEDDFLQIIYKNDKDERICYRTAVGNEDISGDYNIYATTKMIKVGDLDVTARGNENISVAVWNAGDLTYSIQSDIELSEKEIADMIQSL